MSQRGSRGFGSASAFSLIIESYWSIESSSVLEFSTTSRFQNSAYFRMPGIFDWCGCQESAQTPFSDVTQTPSSVLTARLWLPSVWPGVADDRDALAELDVAVEQHEVVLDHAVHAARHVPGPLHRVDRLERVHLLALEEELRVREERLARLGSPLIGFVVPIVRRRSWTCRWSKLT